MSAPVEVRVGSDSDLPKILPAFRLLEELGVPFEARVLSAHRTPELMAARARELERDGVRVSIAAAGGSAHLPGMTASETLVPVIGIPVETSGFRGVDSLLSIVQMPEGVPVGGVGVGQAEQAAHLALRILAASDAPLRARLRTRLSLAGDLPDPKPLVAMVGACPPEAVRLAGVVLEDLGLAAPVVLPAADAAGIERSGACAVVAWVTGESLELPGTLARQTSLPVIAAPVAQGLVPADGFVRLYAQGPVAGMGFNRPRNAAIFAAQVAATFHAPVRERLRAFRARLAAEVEAKDSDLRARGLKDYLKGSPSATPPSRT